MNRNYSIFFLALIFLVFPTKLFALSDSFDYQTEASKKAQEAMISCAKDYHCYCVSPTNTFGTNTVSNSNSIEACDAYCGSLKAESWKMSCTLLNGAANYEVGQGNVGSTKTAVTAAPAPETPKKDFIVPVLNVQIPGFAGFTTPTAAGDDVSVNFLAEYINALYGWVIGAAALVAVVMMMVGGLQYVLSRGKPKYIEKARTRITNAITGLVLLLAAYNVAYLIDPNTTNLKSLSLQTVDYIKIMSTEESPVVTGGSVPNQTGASAATGASTTASTAGIICDQKSSVSDIVKSTYGHITFRMGGRYGGKPPYQNGSKAWTDKKGVLYSTYCPKDQICLDCAGYVQFIRDCAGLPSANEEYGTKGIFITGGKAEKIITSTDTSVNGKDLKPGDVIGYGLISSNGTAFGHATIYIGNGKVAQNTPGRDPGKGVTTENTISTSTIISQTTKGGHAAYVRRR